MILWSSYLFIVSTVRVRATLNKVIGKYIIFIFITGSYMGEREKEREINLL